LGIHPQTLNRWAKHGIVKAHAYNAHGWLYEDPGPNPPMKQCSRWNRVVDRAGARQAQAAEIKSKEVSCEDGWL